MQRTLMGFDRGEGKTFVFDFTLERVCALIQLADATPFKLCVLKRRIGVDSLGNAGEVVGCFTGR